MRWQNVACHKRRTLIIPSAQPRVRKFPNRLAYNSIAFRQVNAMHPAKRASGQGWLLCDFPDRAVSVIESSDLLMAIAPACPDHPQPRSQIPRGASNPPSRRAMVSLKLFSTWN
jgi:hypothetical protein